jgi:hypothetical protein
MTPHSEWLRLCAALVTNDSPQLREEPADVALYVCEASRELEKETQ